MPAIPGKKGQDVLQQRKDFLRRQRDADLRSMLKTPEGRRFLWGTISQLCGAFSASYAGNASVTDFNEGKRAVGLALVREAQRVAPADYVHMLQESLAQDTEDAATRELATSVEESE